MTELFATHLKGHRVADAVIEAVHSLSCMHARIVTQSCQHGRGVIQAMLKTQAPSNQFLDHLAL